MKIVIAGASGFIGQALIKQLLSDDSIEIVALSRSVKVSHHPRLNWIQCDLYSLRDLDFALKNCDQAVYLVHSMMPALGLSQGAFYDYDLLLADNFARASKEAGIKHILYLGGMIPKTEKLSWHLKSRMEVEETLRSAGATLTALRAGLIIGPEGSSFEMLKNLVIRLPVLVCPTWTKTLSQPISLKEIIEVMIACILDQSVQGKIYDVAGPEVLSYQSLILKTAARMGLKRRMVELNLIPLNLSKFWVKLITGASKDLVYPLILSLKYEMIADSENAWMKWKHKRISVDEAILEAVQIHKRVRKNPTQKKLTEGQAKAIHEVRSIQRLIHPSARGAEWVTAEYFDWLPKLFVFVVRVKIEGQKCYFFLFHPKIKLLILEKSVERSTPDRQLLYIQGGLLVSDQTGRGRLEFREALQKTVFLSAIHDFVPSLPWPIYRFTQALLHVWVMSRFNVHLKTIVAQEN